MSTPSSSLDQACNDLAAIEAELNALLATKSEASKTATAFQKWRADHSATAAERERLITVIENLEREVTVAEAEQAAAELRKRHAAKVVANQKLAQRIKADLARASAILIALVRDAAQAATEDAEINERLPDDLEPLVPADFIARGRPALGRKEIETSRVWLWVTARTGHLVGDQDSVTDLGNGLGEIGFRSHSQPARKALFEQISYLPEEPGERPEPLWMLRLPRADGPGFEFDGTRCMYPANALAELARGARAKAEPRERPTEIELRPVPSIEKDVA
jgi:hypothetical protein